MNLMDQDLPRIAKNFRAEVFFKVLGLFTIPFGAMSIGAYRSQTTPNEDLIQVALAVVVLVGGLVCLITVAYLVMFFTPKCDSCKVRTRRFGTLSYDNDEWNVTICPCCRERFMHRSFDTGPS
jgi:hypothetical protein